MSAGAPPPAGPQQLTPQTPAVPAVACRILRSPSHESVTTDLSLFSVSSAGTDAAPAAAAAAAAAGRRLLSFGRCDRGHSPNPDARAGNRPADIPEILWFEEETELIRSCAALSQAAGLQKSFSTGDISQLPAPEDAGGGASGGAAGGLRAAVSELALNSLQRSGFLLEHARLDHTSRSCSTWVAVGDVASTSQLPSPHGGQAAQAAAGTAAAPAPAATAVAPAASTPAAVVSGGQPQQQQQQQPATPPPPPPAFTAVDFIRSVNKKVRQNYIRRRLLTTYKALERLSQSEFNLDRLEVTPSTAAQSVAGEGAACPARLAVPGSSPAPRPVAAAPADSTDAAVLRAARQRASKNLPLTIRDVERERGKPLSKYERNMMIFNWLHTLDESTTFVEGMQ